MSQNPQEPSAALPDETVADDPTTPDTGGNDAGEADGSESSAKGRPEPGTTTFSVRRSNNAMRVLDYVLQKQGLHLSYECLGFSHVPGSALKYVLTSAVKGELHIPCWPFYCE